MLGGRIISDDEVVEVLLGFWGAVVDRLDVEIIARQSWIYDAMTVFVVKGDGCFLMDGRLRGGHLILGDRCSSFLLDFWGEEKVFIR